jgi:hypothetical protein
MLCFPFEFDLEIPIFHIRVLYWFFIKRGVNFVSIRIIKAGQKS